MAVGWSSSIVGTASISSAVASVDLTTLSAGDLAFVLISRSTTASPTSAPTGWELLESVVSTYQALLYAKVLEATDLTTVTWSFSTATKTYCTAHILAGADTSTPIDDSAIGTTLFSTSTGNQQDFGSLPSSAPYILALASGYRTAGAASIQYQPDGLTERHDSGDSGSDYWHYAGDRAWAGGTYAPSVSANYYGNEWPSYRVGFLVGVNEAGAAPADAPMTTTRGIW